MKFSDSVQQTRLINMVPKQEPLPTYLIPFFPFPPDIWSYVMLVYLIGIVLIFSTKKLIAKLNINVTHTRYKRKSYTFGEIVMMILKICMFEGVNSIQYVFDFSTNSSQISNQ